MSEQLTQPDLETASVSDRGLSEKRPHNEDSFLLDPERRIFAVADGVGGANAGEVASQTAVEVLDEAFRHHTPGEDAEDLLELAIQRANASIHQMSREQKQLASMATTIVALHLEGRQATVGHVGDSRLYRLDPQGRLHRETDDHSVVEEEVRAGRMTAEQAAHHPSRNVISRALGAEPTVEVDLKTFEVEDGTIFLLCSDGITRHLSDAELSAIMRAAGTLEEACAEMKRRCFERGAEDNLTAVTVRLGARMRRPADAFDADDEITLVSERDTQMAEQIATASQLSPTLDTPNATAASKAAAASAGIGRSRIAGELRDSEPSATRAVVASEPGPTGRAGNWLMTILLLLIVGAGAFYGGLKFQQSREMQDANQATTTQTPAPLPTVSDPVYEGLRQQVDAAPLAESSRMASETSGKSLDSNDARFLSLYGRALLLSGKNQEALSALRLADQKIGSSANAHDTLSVDTRIALAAAAVRANDESAVHDAAQSLSALIDSAQTSGATSASPGASGPSPGATAAAASPTATPF
ncbi:MAG: family protein phosphatase [Acidobacteriota bacterium]|nr:family protein phosphatase [Acidobacteriota bacterium]